MSAKTIIIYDADCGLCTAFVNWVRATAAKANRPTDAVAYHDPHGPARHPRVDWNYGAEGMQVVTPDGEVIRDNRAAAHCLRLLPGWAVLGWLIDLPVLRLASAFAYRIVARNRSRISGWLGLTRCRLPAAITRPLER